MFGLRNREGLHSFAWFSASAGADVVGMEPLPDTSGETYKLQFIKEVELFYV